MADLAPRSQGLCAAAVQEVTVMRLVITKVVAVAAVVLSAPLAAQVQTEVPPVVASAKPVAVERIKIHGKTLEGNLEGDAVDRDVLVFLPPGYAHEKLR